jgi:hypothetical protein
LGKYDIRWKQYLDWSYCQYLFVKKISVGIPETMVEGIPRQLKEGFSILPPIFR